MKKLKRTCIHLCCFEALNCDHILPIKLLQKKHDLFSEVHLCAVYVSHDLRTYTRLSNTSEQQADEDQGALQSGQGQNSEEE